ncbi:hypothetical protein [Dryocola sp. BD613]|uniref:hypothetical protein n=1 Tax=Dryocola sp. BD613 TaxID=3133272 RepID=UPI003F509089
MERILIDGKIIEVGFEDGLYVATSDSFAHKEAHIDRDAFIALLAKELRTTAATIEKHVSNFIQAIKKAIRWRWP